MPQIGFLPRQQAAISGVVAPGAVLRFYQTGTSTPQNAYTDAALSNAVTSLTADAAGLLAKWYLNPNAAADYRYTLETSAGTVYYTEDDISRLPVSQADIGAALYPQTAAESAAGVTPTNYAYEPGHVLRYGTNATPGTTDMSSAFNNALLTGHEVWVPEGTYLIVTSVAMQNNTVLRMHANAKLIADQHDWAGTDGIINIRSKSNIKIDGGWLDGQKSLNSTGEVYGIDCRGGTNVTITRMRFTNMPGQDSTGITGGDGILIYDNSGTHSENILISDCILDGNCRQGMTIARVKGCVVSNCHFINSSGTAPGGGLDIEGDSISDTVRDITVTGCRFEGNYYGLIVTQAAYNVAVSACTFKGNRFEDIFIGDCENVSVTGCTIEAADKTAAGGSPLVEFNSAHSVTFEGNLLKASSSDSEQREGIRVLLADNVVIAKNIIRGTRSQGMSIGSASQSASFANILVFQNEFIDCVDSSVTSTGVIAVAGNSGSGFYPQRVIIRDNLIYDSRTAGNEADIGIDVSTSIPAATQQNYRIDNNLIIGPAAQYTSGANPPLCGSITWDPASLADGAGETSSGITVNGAAAGDTVEVYAPYDLQDCVATGYVQAADTVEIRLQNESGGVRDLASGTWKVRVRKLHG